MDIDSAEIWLPLVRVTGRGEAPHERREVDRIAAGGCLLKWVDEEGVEHRGRLPEIAWREARSHNLLFGSLIWNGRICRDIHVRVQWEDRIEAPEPAPVEPSVDPDPPTVKRWRDKPSKADVEAAMRDIEPRYALGAHPGEEEIGKLLRATLGEAVTRRQIRAVLTNSRLKGERGKRKS